MNAYRYIYLTDATFGVIVDFTRGTRDALLSSAGAGVVHVLARGAKRWPRAAVWCLERLEDDGITITREKMP